MPIKYSITHDGHFVHPVAQDPVTPQEFIEYEITHAIDERIKTPVSELLEIEQGALKHITKRELSKVLQRRKEIKKSPTPHRCAIVVSHGDAHSYDLVKFYGGMVRLHGPASVIIFGDIHIAKLRLGVE